MDVTGTKNGPNGRRLDGERTSLDVFEASIRCPFSFYFLYGTSMRLIVDLIKIYKETLKSFLMKNCFDEK